MSDPQASRPYFWPNGYDTGLQCERSQVRDSVESQHLVSTVSAHIHAKEGSQGWYGIGLTGLGDWEAMARWGCGMQPVMSFQ